MFLTDGGHHYRIDLKVENGWVVRKVETNETRTSSTIKLTNALLAGEIQEVDAARSELSAVTTGQPSSYVISCAASPAALQVFSDKKRWIDALHAEGFPNISDTVWVRAAIDRLARTSLTGVPQFKISTLQDVQRKVRKAGGDWTLAVPRFTDRGGRGQTRTDPRVETIIQETLDIEKDRRGPIVRTHLIDSIRAKVLEHNQTSPDNPIRPPGESTIDRRIAANFSKYDLHVRKSGRDSANRVYREDSYPRNGALYPLEVSEYDDIDCGVFLINKRLGLPVGRSFLTHGVCQSSSVPLGFDLSHKTRSYESAMGAIACSLLPKDPRRRAFGELADKWIGYGVQGTILLDNAVYNHSRFTATAADDARLALAGTRPYAPTEKCSVEHFNDLIKRDFCQTLPGWRGDKTDPESVKRGVSDSCMDVVDFETKYVKWTVGVYLNNPGQDGLTPRQRWEKHFRNHAPAIRWSYEDVALLRLRPMELTFRASGGLKRLELVYNSDVVAELRREIGHKAAVLAYVDNSDLSYLLVRHPRTHRLLKANYVGDPRFVQGLTAYQQQLVLKAARERRAKNPSIIEMVRAREDLRLLVEQSRRSHKLRERRWAERVGDVPAVSHDLGVVVVPDSTGDGPTHPVERVMTDLEWSIVQLEQVELSAEDEGW